VSLVKITDFNFEKPKAIKEIWGFEQVGDIQLFSEKWDRCARSMSLVARIFNKELSNFSDF
jgi:hypothetical protein